MTTPCTSRPRIAVVGSLNIDLVLQVRHAPGPGETVLADALHLLPGGKGGNQAVACARQGAQVQMFGRIGDDAHGRILRARLDADGIDHSGVQTDPNADTGMAAITVDAAAQNRIVVVPGANGRFMLDTDALRASLRQAHCLVMQFEIPLPQVLAAAGQAQAAGCPVLLNPSPMAPLPALQALPGALWPLVDTLVVNEVEAAALAGSAVATPADAAVAAQTLCALGPDRVVVTLGAAGAVAADAAGCRHHPGQMVAAVDTTAAGDTFLGALAVALAQQQALDAAVRQGIRAATLCVLQAGAQPSIPTRTAVAQSPQPPDWIRL
ncbi:ribokinase [Verminephrobacter eiseniae]|uniref:ribokinase n=1 Tax=Verminephrobacter eiseniae TaxID=364317 RepID=UPI002238EE21|nr:ribokinase [Verminephrobacter eiseniae]MCW5229935.1 ribokinase [Verminephrobacter eiseniae]MCW5291667.1 ribokinase [Verminephrobacter eiseniae]MCW8183444.1 ribokinase [Verminephrobacter eiseniae]MCW8233439.1 ribokinase [Verminephrobacter eiseniae]